MDIAPSTQHRVINPEGMDREKSTYVCATFSLHPRDDVRLSERYSAESYRQQRFRELGFGLMPASSNDYLASAEKILQAWQSTLCHTWLAIDTQATFQQDPWQSRSAMEKPGLSKMGEYLKVVVSIFLPFLLIAYLHQRYLDALI